MEHLKLFLFVVLAVLFYVAWRYKANMTIAEQQKIVTSSHLQKPDSLTILDKKKKPELEWPNTTAPDTTDPYWEFNNNMNINGVMYYKVEMTPGNWQWVENIAANEAIANYNNRKRYLMQALQSRILTDAEMNEVNSHGRDLNIYNMEPYQEEQKQRELNEALLQQHRLRQR